MNEIMRFAEKPLIKYGVVSSVLVGAFFMRKVNWKIGAILFTTSLAIQQTVNTRWPTFASSEQKIGLVTLLSGISTAIYAYTYPDKKSLRMMTDLVLFFLSNSFFLGLACSTNSRISIKPTIKNPITKLDQKFIKEAKKIIKECPKSKYDTRNREPHNKIFSNIELGDYHYITYICNQDTKIKTIISLVDWKQIAIANDCVLNWKVGTTDAQILKNQIQDKGVGIYQYGEGVEDRHYWNHLITKTSGTSYENNNPETWFKEAFTLLDDAVILDKPLFIHCAGGDSRSPVLLIAWLISRIDVTVEEAKNFLRSKRPCVEAIFMGSLKEYESRLREARRS